MKQTITRLKLLLLTNFLLLLGYVSYNEIYLRYYPQQTQAICQILGLDQDKNLIAVNCLLKK
jgi:hypothetical protein